MDTIMKQPDELHREEIGSFWGWLGVGLFFVTAVVMFALFYVQRACGPLGDNPMPDWLYPVIAVFFLAIGFIVANFIRLTISLTPQGITASYGCFRHFEPWDNIAEVERDDSFYGGWGIRAGYKNGGRVLIYNVMGAPVLSLKLTSGRRKYFGFSTKHPDEVSLLIKNWKR